MDLWIVVCEELHSARGPYDTIDKAIEMAKVFTANTACTYRPVPFLFEGEVVQGKDEESTRGYL